MIRKMVKDNLEVEIPEWIKKIEKIRKENDLQDKK